MKETNKRPLEIKMEYFKKLEKTIHEVLHKFHSELFYEEYDQMYDSNAEAEERAKGRNPMNEGYIQKAAEKRKALGVSPLRPNGLPADYSSERYIHDAVFTFLDELKEKTAVSSKKTKGNMTDFLKKH